MFQPKPDGSGKHCAQSLFRIVQFGLLFTAILTREMSCSWMAMNRTRICDSEVHGVQIRPLFGLYGISPFEEGKANSARTAINVC